MARIDHLGCIFQIGAAILVVAIISVFGGSGASGIMFGMIGLFIIAVSLVIADVKNDEEQRKQDEEQRKKDEKQKEEESRKNALQREEWQKSQAALYGRLTSLNEDATSALRSLPGDLSSANRALDKAEAEYAEGVFAPFWDAVEVAIGCLAHYDNNVRLIASHTVDYAEKAKSLESQPPPFLRDGTTIPDATTTVQRLRVIVRRAQKVPDFAKIYEMRRTNSLLAAGFANLGSAIENMGVRINDSIDGLAQTFDSAIASMAQQNAEYYHDSLSAIETMRNQLASDAASLRDQLVSDSEATRKHEGKMEEMTDNLQRRKRPYIEKFRDGQY